MKMATLLVAGFMSANEFSSVKPNLSVDSKIEYVRGVCKMTFTAYNSQGEAMYSWTETRYADSYNQCLQMGLSRLAELNNP